MFRQGVPVCRIDRPTVNADLVVQVRATYEARRANGTDAVTGLDPGAFPNILGNLGQMGIARHNPAAVIDVDGQTVTSDRTGKDHTPAPVAETSVPTGAA